MQKSVFRGMIFLFLCSSVVFSADPAFAQGAGSAESANSGKSLQMALESSQKHLQQARSFREKGKNEPAVAEYKQSIAACPSMVVSYLELGELYTKLNTSEKAVETHTSDVPTFLNENFLEHY